MAPKLFCALVLVFGASACVTDGDDAPPPDDQTQLEPPLPDDDLPDDDLPPEPTCHGHALQSDGACVPKPR